MKLFSLLPLSLLDLALAAKLSISIPPTSFLQNPSTLPSTTFATLHSHGIPHTAYLNRHSTFIFPNLPPGSYLFTAHCRDYIFEPLRVDVSLSPESTSNSNSEIEKVEVWQTFRGNEWSNKGAKRGEGVQEATATVNVLGAKEYYQPREGFNVLSFLKSPMILMALFSLGMIVGIPYLMENMDPETYKEFQDMQKEHRSSKATSSSSNPASQLQNFDMAGWLAGKSSTSESSGNAAKKK